MKKKLNEDSLMGPDVAPLIKSILDKLSQAKLRADAALLSIFTNLQLAVQDISPGSNVDNTDGYDTKKLVDEILDPSINSPKLFVINLPEADVARYFCSEIINRIFRKRKSKFTLIPQDLLFLEKFPDYQIFSVELQ